MLVPTCAKDCCKCWLDIVSRRTLRKLYVDRPCRDSCRGSKAAGRSKKSILRCRAKPQGFSVCKTLYDSFRPMFQLQVNLIDCRDVPWNSLGCFGRGAGSCASGIPHSSQAPRTPVLGAARDFCGAYFASCLVRCFPAFYLQGLQSKVMRLVYIQFDHFHEVA